MKKLGIGLLAVLVLASCGSVRERRAAPASGETDAQRIEVAQRSLEAFSPHEMTLSSKSRRAPEAGLSPATPESDRDPKPVSGPEELESALTGLSEGLKRTRVRPDEPTVIAPQKSRRAEASPDVVLNFENADLYEVLQVFAEILGMTYTVDPRVRGRVTIHTKSNLNREQLVTIFHKVLELNGVAAIGQDGFYEIIPMAEAVRRGEVVPQEMRRVRGVGPDRRIIEIIPCRYIDVTEMTKMIKPFTSEGAGLYEFPLLNMIILADSLNHIQRVRSVVEALDVNTFEGVHFHLYTLLNASVQDVGDDFKAAFESIKLTERFGKNLVFSFTPIPRINSILVISSMPELFEKIESLIQTLDSEAGETEERVYVYRVQNAKAEDMISILEEVYTGEKTDRDKRGTTGTSVIPHRPGTLPAVQPQAAASSTRGAGELTGFITGEVKFVLDDINNAILVRANPRDYRFILNTIQALDLYPRQVLIEILIAEISLDDSTAMGFEWTKLGAQGTGSQVGWTSGLTGTSPRISSGLVYTVNYVDSFVSALRAFASENKVNVLSSPHVIASNNKEAKIDISREVPIVTSQTTTVAATTTVTGGTTTRDQTISYRDTGIILTVTPYINDQGLVKLDINQEVSNIDTTTVVEGVTSPVFFKRVATTTLTVQDGQSVLIGGLISQDKTRNRSGVPGLSKLPVVGWFFGYMEEKITKTELMILLTPRVIEHLEEADLVTAEFRQKVASLRASVERALGD